MEVKWPGREADHAPPSCVKVKTAWSYHQNVFIAWCKRYIFIEWYLLKHGDKFTFTMLMKTNSLDSTTQNARQNHLDPRYTMQSVCLGSYLSLRH
jgi:hypothetical protein